MISIIYFAVISILLYVLFYFNTFLGLFFSVIIFLLIYKVTRINRKQAGNYEKLYQNMPWAPQNITQTISIGKDSGYEIDEKDFGSIAKFYTTISMYMSAYFELTINEKIIKEYEKKYGSNPVGYENLRRDALVYYSDSCRYHPERLSLIRKAIMIKKKPRGNFKEPKQIFST